MNELEVILVHDDLAKRGIKHYDMRPGNDCIWVNYGLVNCYYIFRNGQIVDVQID
jgi:hypothetical protein